MACAWSKCPKPGVPTRVHCARNIKVGLFSKGQTWRRFLWLLAIVFVLIFFATLPLFSDRCTSIACAPDKRAKEQTLPTGYFQDKQRVFQTSVPMSRGELYLFSRTVRDKHLVDFAADAAQFVVSEKYKLLFCTIQKTGNTKMKSLFLRLAGAPQEEKLLDMQRAYKKYSQEHILYADSLPPDSQGHAAHSPDWLRTVVLRDPLERLISAYLDKFVRTHLYIENNISLPSHKGIPPGIVFEATAKSFFQFLQYRENWMSDKHFKLQQNFCGFRTFPRHFWDRVLVYSSDGQTMDEKTMELFEHRVDQEILHNWLPSNGSLWSSKTAHSTKDLFAALQKELCASQTTLSAALDYVQADYDYFGFESPSLCRFCEGNS